jgi:hypothetical protein
VEGGEDAVTSKALQQVSALYSGGGMGSLLAAPRERPGAW